MDLKWISNGIALRELSFLAGEGLSVCDGRSPIFSGPPFAYAKTFWSPLCLWRSPLWPTEKNGPLPLTTPKNSCPPQTDDPPPGKK